MASDKLALAQKMFDAQQLYDKKSVDASGNGEGFPGAKATGNDDAGQPTAAASAKTQPVSEKANAALAGFGQGASMGYMPQLQAVTEPLSTKLMDLMTGGKIAKTKADLAAKGINDTSDANDTYVNRRDAASKRLNDIQAKNPYLYGAGELGGAATSALALPGGAGSEGLTTAQRIARAMKTGAVVGALQNPGDVEGQINPVQAPQRIMNAGVGMGVGALPEAAVPLLQKAAPTLQKLAQREAFAAMGPYARAARKAVGKGDVERIGQTMMDEGVIGGVPTSYSGLEQRAANAAQARGSNLEGYMTDLSNKESRLADQSAPRQITANEPGLVPENGAASPQATPAAQTKVGIGRKAIADQIREDMISAHTDVPGVAKQNEAVEGMLQKFEQGDDSVIPVLDAWRKKQVVGKQINWDRLPGADIPVEEQVNRKLYGNLNQGIKDEAGFIEQQPNMGGENTSPGRFQKLNETIEDLKRGQGMAGQRHAQELAKKAMLPGIGAAYGLTQGDERGGSADLVERLENAAKYAGAGYIANKTLQIGPQVSAPILALGSRGSKAAAKGLLKLGDLKPYSLPAAMATEATQK